MSQILRLAGRIGLKSFQSSERLQLCESCMHLRHGFREYSSHSLEHRRLFNGKKRKKKKGLPDKKELQEKLTQMIEARELQLTSTSGGLSDNLEQERLADNVKGLNNVGEKVKKVSKHKQHDSEQLSKETQQLIVDKFKAKSAESFKEEMAHLIRQGPGQTPKVKQSVQKSSKDSGLFSDDTVIDKFKPTSADSFTGELADLVRNGPTSNVKNTVESVKVDLFKSTHQRHDSEFRTFPLKTVTTTEPGTRMDEIQQKPVSDIHVPVQVFLDGKNKKKHTKKTALNEIYERKNVKIQQKAEKLKAIKKISNSVFNRIDHVTPNFSLNHEFRESLADAKKVFEYESGDMSAVFARAALSQYDVLYDNTGNTSDNSAVVSEMTDSNTVSEMTCLTDCDTEPDNTGAMEHELIDAEGVKIEVSDAEWDVLKKIKKRRSKFVPTMAVEDIHRRDMLNDPYCEDKSMEDNVGLEDITLSDWMQSYRPIEGIITEQAKKTQKKQNMTSDFSEDEIQENVQTEMFNMDFKSYVEACVACRMTQRALDDVNFYRSSGKLHHKITDIEIYNTILRGLGRDLAGIEEVRKVFSMIKEDGLQPNIQTYSICLSCIGKESNYDLLIASFILKDMIKMGLDVRDIFNQCTFVHNERAGVFKMLKKLIKDYEPYPPKSTKPYAGVLVDTLNEPLPPEQKAEVNPLTCGLSKETIMKAAHEQFCNELDQVVTVESVFKTHSKMDVNKDLALKQMKETWRTSIKEAFLKTKASLMTNAYAKPGITMHPFFCLFPVDDYVEILCKELEWWAVSSQKFSPGVGYLKKCLAEKVHKRFIVQQMIDGDNFPKLQKAYSLYVDQLIDPSTPIQTQRECWRRIMMTFSDGNSMERPNCVWSYSVINELGELMYKFLMENARVNTNLFTSKSEKMVSAFFEVVRLRQNNQCIELRPHPMITTIMNAQTDLVFGVNELPSLCPPVPYTSPTQGGNFTSTIELIRTCSERQMEEFIKKSEDCGPVLDSLNVLSTYAWKINKPVLGVILKVFKEGGNPDLDIPILPDNIPKPPRPTNEKSPTMAVYHKKHAAYRKHFMEATSLWWSGLFKLSIANQLRDKTFWIPMNMDFRGRTYPVAGHLNHQGEDYVRSLMLFAKGKPLGDKGFDWLKLHLINLTEFMKRSTFEEKIAYADEIMPDILDSAENPLTGSGWWMKSENPWQTLGVCYEISAAYKSGDPASYVSHYPVHQDGSCNGLQHFAALGRDEAGAKSVNLISHEHPADVYSDVVELVMKEIESDIAEENEHAEIAKICQPYLNRKVIKQSIMTTVYGVTEYGAKLQIQRRLQDKDFPDKHIIDARRYLAMKTFKCLNSLFVSARQIQDWFNRCSTVIASQNETVEWYTPLNFPCSQPYYKDVAKPKNMSGKVFNFLIMNKKHIYRNVNAQKQKNGFSPNFVHSLDSVHMMLTSLYCYRHGLTYSSVHDSFWTHACDVDVMNQATREQFIALHSQPILENLSEHFIETYLKQGYIPAEKREKMMNTFLSLPDRGDLDLNAILKSRYFFS